VSSTDDEDRMNTTTNDSQLQADRRNVERVISALMGSVRTSTYRSELSNRWETFRQERNATVDAAAG
jgi:hypothetical protein